MDSLPPNKNSLYKLANMQGMFIKLKLLSLHHPQNSEIIGIYAVLKAVLPPNLIFPDLKVYS
jgi:hypothetical protein